MVTEPVVLDASALLALLHDEPGADRVREMLPRAVVSTVNLAEVITKLISQGWVESEISQVMQLPFENADFDSESVKLTGILAAKTRRYGLSLGDRACLATALLHGCPALTADRAWTKLTLDIKVVPIR